MAPNKGILLFGLPGNGKTELAKAIASEANCTFFKADALKFHQKFVGVAEKNLKALWQLAEFY